MKRFIVLLSFLCLSHVSHAAAPTTQSLEALLELTQAEKLIDGMKPQINASIKAEIDKALAGRQINTEEQRAINKYLSRSNEILNEYLNFERIKPTYIKLYSETFTQEEVDGMVAFYNTPAGNALIHKMPKLTQNMLATLPDILAPVFSQVQLVVNQLKKDLEAAKKKSLK